MTEHHNNQLTEDKKDRFINNILIIVVLILLVYILFITGVIKINTPQKEKIDEVPEQENKKELKTTDSIITTLYKSVELGRSYNALRHYYFYSYDKLFVKYMDDAFIKEMALSKLTLLDKTTIDANILEKQYKNIVGNNTIYKNRTFQTQCSTLKYNATLNDYTIIKNPTCDTTPKDNDEYFDKIQSAYQYSDRIEINTLVGYKEEKKEQVDEGVLTSTGEVIIKKDMDDTEIIGTFTESLDEIKKKIDESKLAKYKYTFRLDNNNYYFYSVEKVE